MLAHYGVVALPCRIQDPDRKGKVESGIGYTKRTALKGMRFEALEEAQAYLDRWEERWANTLYPWHNQTPGCRHVPRRKLHLLPLPREPFRYYQYGDRVVHLDGCVEVEAAYYGLPPGWIGRSVKVPPMRCTCASCTRTPTNFFASTCVKSVVGYRIEEEDHPKKMPFSTAQLLRRAAHAGTQTGKFCQLLYDWQGETGIRRILGGALS